MIATPSPSERSVVHKYRTSATCIIRLMTQKVISIKTETLLRRETTITRSHNWHIHAWVMGVRRCILPYVGSYNSSVIFTIIAISLQSERKQFVILNYRMVNIYMYVTYVLSKRYNLMRANIYCSFSTFIIFSNASQWLFCVGSLPRIQQILSWCRFIDV